MQETAYFDLTRINLCGRLRVFFLFSTASFWSRPPGPTLVLRVYCKTEIIELHDYLIAAERPPSHLGLFFQQQKLYVAELKVSNNLFLPSWWLVLAGNDWYTPS